jgi:hypothetical protein
MRFDTSKFSFFRFGNCNIEVIKLVGLDTKVYTLNYSKSVRYLGFFLKDGGGVEGKGGVDMDHHVAERCNKVAMNYEKIILKWCANNIYFNNRVKRSVIQTRCIPKLFFGVQGIMACTHLQAFRNHWTELIHVDAEGRLLPKPKTTVRFDWYKWDKMDAVNRLVCPLAKELTRGMSNE